MKNKPFDEYELKNEFKGKGYPKTIKATQIDDENVEVVMIASGRVLRFKKSELNEYTKITSDIKGMSGCLFSRKHYYADIDNRVVRRLDNKAVDRVRK